MDGLGMFLVDWQGELDKRGLQLDNFKRRNIRVYVEPRLEDSFGIDELMDIVDKCPKNTSAGVFCELSPTDENGDVIPTLRVYTLRPETDEEFAMRLLET